MANIQGHNDVFDKKELKERYEGRVSKWNDMFEKFKTSKYMSGEDYEVDDLEKWANEEDDFTDNESGVEFDDEEEDIEPFDKDLEAEEDNEELDNALNEIELEKFESAIKEVQDQVFVLEEDDVKCHVCKTRMFLPYLYIAELANEDAALCDDCLLLYSGHENCDLPGCEECLRLIHKIKIRRELATDFVSGTLMRLNDAGDDEKSLQENHQNMETDENMEDSQDDDHDVEDCDIPECQ